MGDTTTMVGLIGFVVLVCFGLCVLGFSHVILYVASSPRLKEFLVSVAEDVVAIPKDGEEF